MYLEDLSFRFFDAVVHRVGLAACFGLGATGSLIGLLLLARRMPRAGWPLLVAGIAFAGLGLVAISECRTQTALSPVMTARSFSFPDPTREAAQLGMLAVPALAVIVKLARDKSSLLRRRSLLPTYLRMATKAYYAGDLDRAIADYSIAIRVDPARPESYVRRGLAWTEKGRYDRAISDFDRALKMDVNHGAARLHRGVVLAARGDHLAAIDDYDQAHLLDSTDAAPLLHRGLSLARLGESSRAARDFRHVLRLTNHPDFADPARFHLTLIEEEEASGLHLALSPGADDPDRHGSPGRIPAEAR